MADLLSSPAAFAERPGVRLTYDRGTLELKILSHEHESYGYLMGRIVDTLTEELGLPVSGGGTTAFWRRQTPARLVARCLLVDRQRNPCPRQIEN